MSSGRQSHKQSNKEGNNTFVLAGACLGATAVLLGGLLYTRAYSNKASAKPNKEQEKTEAQNDKTKGGAERTPDSMEHGEATTQEEMKIQWDNIVQEAKQLFSKKQDYLAAAAKYSEALKLTPLIEEYAKRTPQLLNNRSAMYEKAGDHARCILDCNLCLMDAPEHKLARVRKARVYEAMGRMDDALTELCAHMIVEKMKEVRAKNEGQPIPEFTIPQRLDPVTTEAARKMTSNILDKRNGEPAKHFIPSSQILCDILRSFESYSNLEDSYGTMPEAKTTERLETASSPVEKISALTDRAMVRILQRQYEGAKKDITEAHAELKEAGDEEVGHEKAADVYAWYGMFLYLTQVRDSAKEAFDHSCELNDLNPEVWIKLAGLALDNEDAMEAKRLFDKAMSLNDKYSTTYLFRAQYHAFNGEFDKALEDLQTCLDLNPKHISAYGRMITMKIQSGDAVGAKAVIDSALEVSQPCCTLDLHGRSLFNMCRTKPNVTLALMVLCCI